MMTDPETLNGLVHFELEMLFREGDAFEGSV
jgi:hypothetical protein